MDPLIIQIIGFFGLLFVVISFQKNKRSFTLLSQLVAASFFTVHFFLLNAFTAAAMNLTSASRAYVFNLRESNKWINSPITMYMFIALFWIAGLLTWQGLISILPILSMTLECFALWSRDTRRLRWIFLSARPGWMIYNYLVGSYAGLATEAFIVGSLGLAIIRFDILKK